MNRIVIGVDIAKRVFQLHWVRPETGEIVALQLKREKFLEHFCQPLKLPNRHGSVRRFAALGPIAAEARSRGEVDVSPDGEALCGRQQERYSGCARDLDGGTTVSFHAACEVFFDPFVKANDLSL